jgi:hypothetical protein
MDDTQARAMVSGIVLVFLVLALAALLSLLTAAVVH